MKRYVLTILIFCTAAGAQQSPLGVRYPFGIPDLAVTGASSAMGGSGAAVVEEQMGICLNPANAAIGNRAAFSALVSFDMTGVSDSGGSSNLIRGYSPGLLSLIIPLNRAGNAAFAMQKQYNANLNFGPDTVHGAAGYDIVDLYRKGGVTAWQAGWAYRFRGGFGVGILYEQLFFNNESRLFYRSRLNNLNNEHMITAMTIEEDIIQSLSIGSIRFGMQIPVHEKVTLAAAAAGVLPPGKDNGAGTLVRSYIDNTSTMRWVSSKKDTAFSAALPSSFNIGAAYKPDDHWLFAIDAHSTLWDLWRDQNDGFGNYDVRTAYGVSVGARFTPAVNILSSSYVEKIHYSGGLRYASLPHDGNSDHEYALHFGTGLPIANDGGIIDVVFGFGQRIDTRFPRYAENVFKIQLGINGGRSWYQRGDI